MSRILATLMLSFPAFATPAAADVTAVTPASFVIEHSVTVAADGAATWDIARAPHKWWHPDHTYSGDSANLYMDAQATGCFCERIPEGKGSVEHAHLVYVAPGRMIRMTGGLGPLQAEAVAATLTIRIDPAGAATKVTLTYVVGGFMRQGGETLAPAVDKVLGTQLDRLKAAAEAAGAVPPAPEKK